MRILILLFIMFFSATQIEAGTSFGGLSYTASGGTDYTQDANCVGAWYMNVSNNTETDRSGNSADLSQFGGSVPTSSDVPAGYSGTSRDFEADDTEALVMADGGSTDITGASSFTICFWIKMASDTGTVETVLSKYDQGAGARQFRSAFSVTGLKIEVRVSPDGSSTTADQSDTDITVGTWFHYAGVFDNDNNTLTVFINGSQDGDSTAYTSDINDGSARFMIGAQDNGGSSTTFYYDGLVDEAIIFNRVLSPTEISEIYTYGIDGANGGND